MWEKVVLNLLSRTHSSSPSQGEIAVTTKPSSDGGGAEVTVRDTGTGIPAEELPHLFERFRRVEGARGRSIEGSGIGLALVQELVGCTAVRSGVSQRSWAWAARSRWRFPSVPPTCRSTRIGRARTPATTNVRAHAYIDEALGWLSDASCRLTELATGLRVGRCR